MTGGVIILSVLGTATLAVIAALVRRPEWTNGVRGKILAFLALLALPGLLLVGGAGRHYEQAKTTSFCLSCHVIQPYGESLYIDHPRFLPAVHYQNQLIPADKACYTCHTSYTMFGDVDDKIRGVRHVWHSVMGSASDPVKLYEPYENRACLECHEGARSYEEHTAHTPFRSRPDRRDEIVPDVPQPDSRGHEAGPVRALGPGGKAVSWIPSPGLRKRLAGRLQVSGLLIAVGIAVVVGHPVLEPSDFPVSFPDSGRRVYRSGHAPLSVVRRHPE